MTELESLRYNKATVYFFKQMILLYKYSVISIGKYLIILLFALFAFSKHWFWSL